MPDKTINEWCLSRNISRTTYYSLKKKKLAPESYEVPGERGERITPAADAAWEKKMIKLKQSKEAKRAAERRRQSAQNAARIAVASPLHVSNAKKKAAPLPAAVKKPIGKPRKLEVVVT